jgi:DNA-binding transcriptional LysR family regulator
MDKYVSMRTAVAVAEQGNFTAAAAKLGVSASTVTKLIARLEEDLGIKLFHRTTRKLALTEAGQEYCERCTKIIAEIHEAESTLKHANTSTKGTVRLVVPNLFGRLTLIPELARFYERYPDVDLSLAFSDRPIDLVEAGYDLGVHTGEIGDPGVLRRLLIRGPQVTAASPDYLRKHGTPRHPDDLHEHNCIYGRFGPEWHFQPPNGGRQRMVVKGNLVVFSGDALREAAVCGLGIVHSTWWALRHDLEAGRLKQILADYVIEGAPVSVAYPANRHLPTRVRAVIDFLVEITAPKRRKGAEARTPSPRKEVSS